MSVRFCNWNISTYYDSLKAMCRLGSCATVWLRDPVLKTQLILQVTHQWFRVQNFGERRFVTFFRELAREKVMNVVNVMRWLKIYAFDNKRNNSWMNPDHKYFHILSAQSFLQALNLVNYDYFIKINIRMTVCFFIKICIHSSTLAVFSQRYNFSKFFNFLNCEFLKIVQLWFLKKFSII